MGASASFGNSNCCSMFVTSCIHMHSYIAGSEKNKSSLIPFVSHNFPHDVCETALFDALTSNTQTTRSLQIAEKIPFDDFCAGCLQKARQRRRLLSESVNCSAMLRSARQRLPCSLVFMEAVVLVWPRMLDMYI